MPQAGLHEARTRVICQLPCGNAAQEKAVFEIFEWLREQREKNVPLTGYTHSRLRPPSYEGWWFGRDPHISPHRSQWIQDKLVTLIIDYKLDFSSQDLTRAVKDLHLAVKQSYARHRARQTEFWITTQQIFRYS